jgi:hypothetical protein
MARCLPTALIAAVLLGVPPAIAAPPNDSPAGAGVFAPYTAPNGVPTQQEAAADLAAASADRNVPRCLGDTSFARTVWYRIPEGPVARLLTVEAVGRTAAAIDLAAFVQPLVPPPPPPPAPTPTPPPTTTPEPTATPTATPVRAHAAQSSNVREPNQCDGIGAGGGADSPDRTSAVTMLVPGGFPVLIQVGRRGTVGTSENEQALVTLEATDVALAPTPRGDSARTAPRLHKGGNFIDLAGATITEEDPAQPPCPSLGTVWRKLVPGADGQRVVSVSGSDATSLAVFSGRKPTGDDALDCVDRRTSGALQVNVPVEKRKPVWVRVGVDRFEGDEEATVTVREGEHANVINGGPGGFDPTPFGPGGGLPTVCESADANQSAVAGDRLHGLAADYNRFTDVPVTLTVSGGPLCDATLKLFGPRGHLYARGRYIVLKPKTATIALPRRRTFVAGRYHLEARGIDLFGRRVDVKTSLRGKLKRPKRRHKK